MGGECGVERRDGEVGANDEAFGGLRLGLGGDGQVGCHCIRSSPLARAEAGVEASVVPPRATGKRCQAVWKGERVVGRVDPAVNAAIGNGAYDGKAVDKALDEVPVEMPDAVDEGSHVARVHVGCDPRDRGRHQGVDGYRDGAAHVGEGGHVGHSLHAKRGQSRALLQRGADGALRLVGE